MEQEIGNYEMLEVIGSGNYSYVYKAKSQRDNQHYAIKIIDLCKFHNRLHPDFQLNEIRVLQ